MQFKTQRQSIDYVNLVGKNPKLVSILEAADSFSKHEFGHEIVITDVYRSLEEYKEIYKEDPSRIPKSLPHANWQAADLRSSIYTPEQITKFVAFLNHFTVFGGQAKCAMYHMIAGQALHFHIQCGTDEKV